MDIFRRLFGRKNPNPPLQPPATSQTRGDEREAHEQAARSPPLTMPSGQLSAELSSRNDDIDGKFIQAIKDRNIGSAQTLLALGASASAQAKFSHHAKWAGGAAPAIHFALPRDYENEEPCLRIIDLLQKSGADIDAPGCDGWGSKDGPFTPLMNAVQRKKAKTVAWLIEHGASTSVRTSDGKTLFQISLGGKDDDSQGYWDVRRTLAKHTEDGKIWAASNEGQEWLRDRAKDVTAPLGVSRAGAWSAFQSSEFDFNRRQNEIVAWVEAGGDVHWTCSDGYTLLHYAARQNNEKIVSFLLDHGANVNARARYGWTPLLCACQKKSKAVIPVLLDRGADPNAQTDGGSTALEALGRSADAEKMAQLLKPDLNA